jgi:hypothetical protein
MRALPVGTNGRRTGHAGSPEDHPLVEDLGGSAAATMAKTTSGRSEVPSAPTPSTSAAPHRMHGNGAEATTGGQPGGGDADEVHRRGRDDDERPCRTRRASPAWWNTSSKPTPSAAMAV